LDRTKWKNIEDIIHAAVYTQRIASERQVKNAFTRTEQRLYAYPIIKLKIIDDIARLDDMKQHGAPQYSRSIIRHLKTGIRLTADEIADAQIQDLKAEIAGNELEVETVDRALLVIHGDPYAEIIKYKYFENVCDDRIGQLLYCDPSTVRRNKSRLIRRIAVFLYGAEAVS
jgi:hypothetical protein